jgi:hypothetical protein
MAGKDIDRFGYEHRRDSAYGIGESMPGDVGDSQGTFQNQNQGTNVIVDGKVIAYDDRNRQSSTADKQKTTSRPQQNRSSTELRIPQAAAVGRIVDVRIRSMGGSLGAIGEYKNHQVHTEDGLPGESITMRLEKGNGYLIGHRVVVRE